MIPFLQRCRRRRPRGQVLLVAVTVLIILLVVALFLFDLQGIVRLRASTQTGADAAVLAAAGWQARSLNMIGEINLLKAATVLVSDVPPYGDGSAEGVLESSEALSQLQLRLTYAGPLLGLAASQQAAKRNGMYDVSDFTWLISSHVDNYIDGGLFESIYPTEVYGYEWIEPYGDMLRQIVANRIAAAPLNSRFLAGGPHLTGPGAFLLMQPDFYAAVHARHFCWFYRQGLTPADNFNFDLVEYSINQSAFFPGSEYCPLYVDFATGNPGSRIQPLLAERGLTARGAGSPGFSDVEWAVYESVGDGEGWDAVDRYRDLRPYMRSRVRPEYTYGGAAVRMYCASRPSLVTGWWTWEHGADESEATDSDLGDALSWSDTEFGPGDSYAAHGRRLSRAEGKLHQLRSGETVESVAAAKPFGSLDGGVAPQDAGIVLPVFDAVRLIPAALVRVNVYERDPTFLRFLTEFFGHPDYPNVPPEIRERYRWYVEAMQQFMDPNSDFRDAWWEFDAWREQYMAGPDLIPGTDDDLRDPCLPGDGGGGGGPGGGGGGSIGGPPILH